METRRAYDYAKPATLIMIIDDALDHVSRFMLASSEANIKGIVSDAWAALVANVGEDDAIQMAMYAGFSLDELERFS